MINNILARLKYEVRRIIWSADIEFNLVKARVDNIEGWILDDAGYLLYCLSKRYNINIIVELGSWQGKSSTWIASGLEGKHGAKLYCVDTWAGSPVTGARDPSYQVDVSSVFDQNMKSNKLDTLVEKIQMRTCEAAIYWNNRDEKQIDMLIIDADHSYQAVCEDYEKWSHFVPIGGFIVFDDVPSWSGPTRLCSELERERKIKVILRAKNTVFVVKIR